MNHKPFHQGYLIKSAHFCLSTEASSVPQADAYAQCSFCDDSGGASKMVEFLGNVIDIVTCPFEYGPEGNRLNKPRARVRRARACRSGERETSQTSLTLCQ